MFKFEFAGGLAGRMTHSLLVSAFVRLLTGLIQSNSATTESVVANAIKAISW